jgi:hypothetical protein
MPLFDLTRPEAKGNEANSAFLKESRARASFINGASLKLFKEVLKTIEKNRHYHYSTGGQWSLHELVAYLVQLTGPCKVWKCTWAISEDSVRSLLELRERGMITDIKCLYSYKITENKSKAYFLAKENFDVVLTHCHAKVTVLKNEEWSISICGSQNDTRNPRIERGVICTDRAIAEADITWMEAVRAGKKPFKVRNAE